MTFLRILLSRKRNKKKRKVKKEKEKEKGKKEREENASNSFLITSNKISFSNWVFIFLFYQSYLRELRTIIDLKIFQVKAWAIAVIKTIIFVAVPHDKKYENEMFR